MLALPPSKARKDLVGNSNRFRARPFSFQSISSETGGAAIEYILVSCFAVVVTIAGLTYLSKAFESQLDALAEELELEEEFTMRLPFSSND